MKIVPINNNYQNKPNFKAKLHQDSSKTFGVIQKLFEENDIHAKKFSEFLVEYERKLMSYIKGLRAFGEEPEISLEKRSKKHLTVRASLKNVNVNSVDGTTVVALNKEDEFVESLRAGMTEAVETINLTPQGFSQEMKRLVTETNSRPGQKS